MHQRKSQMADLSDGFIALPGGIGTLEGFFEMPLALRKRPKALATQQAAASVGQGVLVARYHAPGFGFAARNFLRTPRTS
jgi:hypothetical protein